MRNIISILTLLIFFSISSCNENGKTTKTRYSSSESSDVNGYYSDFSGWYGGISGGISVRGGSWSGNINDNGSVTSYRGSVSGTDLLDEYGMNKLGYISGNKVYIYYLNGYYPVGK